MLDEWPPVRCPRFDGESLDAYTRRKAKVVEIVTNFRRGVYRGDLAERMERHLIALQSPALEHAV